ncbi:MAG: hypothetical protein P1P73_04770 [Brevefilum sp.]|nr:hypothetical protein [Brevefilum sp.]MDW7753873.1 hypothetical protein [Brevefilum sp.]
MSFKKSVVIFGRSLYLAGIGACLKREHGLDVCEIDPQDPVARQSLEAMTPAVILFDLSDPPGDLDMGLLKQQPSKVVTVEELSKLNANQTG